MVHKIFAREALDSNYGLRLVAFIFCELLFGLCSGYSSHGQQLVDERALSALMTVIDNAEGIEKGDVLIMDRRFYDGVFKRGDAFEGGTLNQILFKRVIFDAEKGIFLVSAKTLNEWLDLESDGATKHKEKFLTTYIDFNEKKLNLLQDGERRELKLEPENLGDFDPRSIGMMGTSYRDLNTTKQLVLAEISKDQLDEFRPTEKGIELTLILPNLENGKYDAITSYLFDPESNLPQRVTTFVRIASGGESTPKSVYYGWEPMGGLHTPVSVKKNYMSEFITAQGLKKPGKMDLEIRLHWFSINEPISKELLDKKVLNDELKLRELVDPEKSGAVSILEILEKLSGNK